MMNSRIQWRLVLELKSPIQIGAGSLGMVEKTDLYIPGRIIWAAMTATLVRRYIPNPEYKDFETVGNLLGPHEKYFSSFFPSFDYAKTEWLPIFKENKRSWVMYNCESGNFDLTKYRSEEEMQAVLVSGRSGNAIDPSRMTNFDKSLHETDEISCQIREGKSLSPVCFTGSLQLPEKLDIADGVIINEGALKTVFVQCRLGGGRKKGRGIIRISDIRKDPVPYDALDMRKFPDSEENILLTAGTHEVLKTDSGFNGRVFLATYRQYSKEKGQGRGFSLKPRLCWEAGTLIRSRPDV